MSLKDQILSAEDCPLYPVHVPQWNATIYVPSLSIKDLEDIQKASKDEDEQVSSIKLVVRILRDEAGNPVFTDDDIDALRKKSFAAVNRIVDEFNVRNGLNDGAVEDEKKD